MRTHTSRSPATRPMEHRWGERVALDIPALLLLPDDTEMAGRLRNASISGAWIDTTARLPPYSTLTVCVSVGEAARRRNIELQACVVRTTSDGVAVEWRDMAVPTLIKVLREAGCEEQALYQRDRAFA